MEFKVLRFPERVTAENAGELKQRIRDACGGKPWLLQVDLEGVAYMDSGGLGVLVFAFEHARTLGGALRVHRPPPAVRDLLHRSRFDHVLEIVEDPPDETTPAILVADDDPDIRKLVERLLERARCQVLVARDGQEAVELARRERPALILMDLIMPGLDGEDAARILKEDPLTADIPIVALTAKYGGPVAMPYFDRYLSKPFQLADLRSILMSIVPELDVTPEPRRPAPP